MCALDEGAFGSRMRDVAVRLSHAMNRSLWPVLVVATATFSCGIDTTGLGTSESLGLDAADGEVADSASLDTDIEEDTFVADTFVDDTTVVDTFVADTFVVDAFVADTFVPDTPEVGPPFCDATDTTLIGCYRFEGNGNDESAFKNNLTATGVTYPGGVSGKALSLGGAAKVSAPDTASLAVTNALTIELWVKLSSLPTSGRMGLVDDDGRFGLFVYPPGVARATSPAQLDTPSSLPTKTWTHVAFTYDGATMTLYVNGTSVATSAIVGTFGAPSGSGLAVGMNSPSGDVLDGAIDSLRLYRVARTAKQICQSAGTC